MNKFQNDNNVLASQNAAFQAKAAELRQQLSQAEAGVAKFSQVLCGIREDFILRQQADEAEKSCKAAIKAGATIKDLPAH